MTVTYVGAPGFQRIDGRVAFPRCDVLDCYARPRWRVIGAHWRWRLGGRSEALLCRHHAEKATRRYGAAGLRAS